jgi:hypothetical protein
LAVAAHYREFWRSGFGSVQPTMIINRRLGTLVAAVAVIAFLVLRPDRAAQVAAGVAAQVICSGASAVSLRRR